MNLLSQLASNFHMLLGCRTLLIIYLFSICITALPDKKYQISFLSANATPAIPQ